MPRFGRIQAQVLASPGLSLAVLLASEPEISANDVYGMLVQGQLYADLKAVPLVQHTRVELYADLQTSLNCANNLNETRNQNIIPHQANTLKAGTQLIWDSRLWTLVNLGEKTTTLIAEQGQPLQIPSTFFNQLVERGAISLNSAEKELWLRLSWSATTHQRAG